jgi:hypothetical protein
MRKRTKNIEANIEMLLSRLFRTANSLQRYMAAQRRQEAAKRKEREALRKPKPVKPSVLPKQKPVELQKPKMTKAERPKGYSVEVFEPEPPAPPTV